MRASARNGHSALERSGLDRIKKIVAAEYDSAWLRFGGRPHRRSCNQNLERHIQRQEGEAIQRRTEIVRRTLRVLEVELAQLGRLRSPE